MEAILCNGNYFLFRRTNRISIHGVTLVGCSKTIFTSVRSLTIHDTHFEHHGPLALNSVLSATIINSSITNGCKLLVHNSTLLVKETLFSNLTASDNYFEWDQDPHGGAMQTDNSNITIEQCLFLNNILYSFNSSTDSWGGAVYANNTRLNVTHSNFTGNSAAEAGGAISATNTLVQITYSLFSNNSATGKGGAIHIIGLHTTSSIIVYQGTFITNTAGTGGALYTAGNGIVIVINMSTFFSNAAYVSGGAGNAGVLYAENSSLSIAGSSFDGNKAGLNGGVIYWYAATPRVNVSISHSDFSNNLALKDGGVMYVNSSGSQVTVTNCTFAYNNATETGGAITIFGSRLSFYHNMIFDNYGVIINACRSNVTASDDIVQIVEPNPNNNSHCSLYDEYPDMPPADNVNTTETTEASFTTSTSAIPHTTDSSEATTPSGTKANTLPGTNETPTSQGPTTERTSPSSIRTEGQSAMPTIPSIYAAAIYTTLGIAIVVCVLLALLYIIVLCIVFYLCGVFKSKKRLVDNPYVYVPMKENESNTDNEIASQA